MQSVVLLLNADDAVLVDVVAFALVCVVVDAADDVDAVDADVAAAAGASQPDSQVMGGHRMKVADALVRLLMQVDLTLVDKLKMLMPQ